MNKNLIENKKMKKFLKKNKKFMDYYKKYCIKILIIYK